MKKTALIVAFLSLVTRATAHRGCGTKSPPPEKQLEVAARLANVSSSSFRAQSFPETVQVSYHIIHDGSNGNYDDAVVNQQMQVLNAAFAGSGFSFTLREIERTNNAAWFQNCGAAEDGMGGNEMQMKTALRKAGDNLDVLYIYTCIPGEDAGYATFPDDGLTLVEDGIVILYTTLPGGTAEGQNEGDTITHEVGHWLGLYHTFENGCNAPGDSVADTPAVAGEKGNQDLEGCPNPPGGAPDSCPNDGQGPDLINNFMDYTDDECVNSFTAGQRQRMQQIWTTYRAQGMPSPTDPSTPAPVNPTTPTPPTPSPTDDTSACFSGKAEVEVFGKGKTSMKELRIGDLVLTAKGTYSEVYSFGHYSSGPQFFEYLQILADTMEKAIEISTEHMILVNNELKAARDVQIGDFFTNANGESVVVKSIRPVKRRGYYAPWTVAGDIVVNGVVASNYYSIPWLEDFLSGQTMHLLQHGGIAAPYRALCMLARCDNELRDESTGFTMYLSYWDTALQWFVGQTSFFKATALVFVAPLASVAVFFGKILSEGNFTVLEYLATMLLSYFAWKLMSKSKSHSK